MSELEFAKACLEGAETELRQLDELIRKVTPHDDVRQAMRQRLLVDKRLSQFNGKGSLVRWLRTVAARMEIDLSRGSREQPVENDVLEALLPPIGHFENELVRDQAREAMKAALGEALRTLSDREQLFIQHTYVDGLTLTAIGKLYGVAPSTVMRALDKSLAKLREAARAHLSQVLNLGERSLESLVRDGLKTRGS